MMNYSRTTTLSSLHYVLRAFVVVALILVAGCQAQPPEPSTEARLAVDRLLQLVDERLAVAPDVARAKWNSGASINAPEREAQILERVVVDAAQAGVDESFAQAFFENQFEASKIVQYRLHDQWKRESRPPFDNPPDLTEDVRPVLDRLTPQLIASLRDFQSVARNEGARQYLEDRAKVLVRDDFGGAARDKALQPLFEAAEA